MSVEHNIGILAPVTKTVKPELARAIAGSCARKKPVSASTGPAATGACNSGVGVGVGMGVAAKQAVKVAHATTAAI